MRGNNFLPIEFGKRQKQILNPQKNNRRVIHYSYNLINNINEEEQPKRDNSVQQLLNASSSSFVKSNGTSTTGYARPVLAKRQSTTDQRKSSVPSIKNPASEHNLHGINSKKPNDDVHFSTRQRTRNTTLNYSSQTVAKHSQKAELPDFENYSALRSGRTARFNDPLYEQRSLPPLPHRNPTNSEASTANDAGSTYVLGKQKPSQLSKSQNSLLNITSSVNVPRKEGISAVENQDIMHAKMRKRGVCDKTDDSHYQRQFLRVLNKRF